MSQINETITTFLNVVKEPQTLWALQDTESEDWVVLDSINYENSDVMPVWDSKEKAQAHCIDEWKAYQAVAISLAEWFEFWVEDLISDNMIIGVNWPEEGDVEEMELVDFSQALSQIEVL